MPDYAAMYKKLFNSQTDAIALLQQAQRETEEMYVSAPDPDIRVLEPKKEADHEDTD
ncbi:hypothetical protein [Ohessyouella blattaphilus]|uniref:Uncharacterized protein n=1 Tax=Ohessyouella blattaphilus TaxID=2949333 RepID=A0ABT1EJ40_9FIRM|nr:hypothetical protein [Ohessyouella blattaphilus]MCP1109711.1 hypothetical protein [Ohessyouella blattaphilus]MCR8563105.1 hypothetical protein [Ohessyouella blattaphilus]